MILNQAILMSRIDRDQGWWVWTEGSGFLNSTSNFAGCLSCHFLPSRPSGDYTRPGLYRQPCSQNGLSFAEQIHRDQIRGVCLMFMCS